MRILCLCYEYPPVGGGGASFCEGICEAFVRAGHSVDVVTSGMRGLERVETRAGVEIHRVPCVRRHEHYTTTPELVTQIIPALREARRLLNERRYDIVHCHFVIPTGLTAYLLRRRIPYVITAHGSDIPGYNPDRFSFMHVLLRPLWKRIIRGCAALTTPSHFLAELARKSIDVEVDVIPYGFEPPPHADVDRRNRILVVTRMFERKGVQYLIRALQQIDTDWEILIAGDGPYLPALETLAAEAEVPAKFMGQVPRDDLPALYQSARIFVFPSIQENFPVVLLEAMASGCAVITSSAEGCAEVVGDAAIKVASEQVDGLRDALRRLLDDPERVRQLSAAAEERIAGFKWERIVSDYIALFERCIASGRARS